MRNLSLPINRILFTVFLLSWLTRVESHGEEVTREGASFDRGWKFHLGEASGAEQPGFEDASWRSLDIPHDWMIEGVAGSDPAAMDGPFDKNSPALGSGGFMDGGIGWYRKTFTLPASAEGRHLVLLFDGAYMDSQVWLNGKLLGTRPYGYSSFYYDLTPEAHFGDKKNVVAVRLNVEQPSSRWYSGAGLYRHVWLVTTDPVHVAMWGTYVTTPKASVNGAEVHVQTKVSNDGDIDREVSLATRLLDPDGKEVGNQQVTKTVHARAEGSFDQTLSLPAAKLWSPDTPVLYHAVNEIRINGNLTDTTTTPFGIRTMEFTKHKGFFLNGEHVQIKGVCDHHDLGCLGSVALRRGFQRQLEILKSMGCNALRTSHNPPSPELLDLCDQMGVLVMDEAFDEWKEGKRKFGYGRFFDQWSDLDITTMVDRDRNHPSVILWSIGNEINEGKLGAPGTALATSQRLVADCHREDPSRPVTAACAAPWNDWTSGLAQALDVFGVNYHPNYYSRNDPAKIASGTPEKPGDYPPGQLPMIGSETASAVSSRGEYGLTLDAQGNLQRNADLKDQVTNYGDFPIKFTNRAEGSLLAIKKSPWIAGEFVWTGFDYIGEPSPYPWPARSSYYGILDLCGFPKDRYYLYKSQWSSEPVVHVLPHWTWPGFEGKPIPVVVYTNADSVELFINGQSLGVKNFPADTEKVLSPPVSSDKKADPFTQQFDPNGKREPSLHLAWSVLYAPGILKAVAKKNGQVVATDEVHTAGAPAALTLTPDRSQIIANGQDLSFIKVTVLDKDGNVCPDAANEVEFKMEGAAAELAGLGDGDPTNHEPFQGTRHKTFHGLALAVLKSAYDHTGSVTLTATSGGLPAVTTTVEVVAP
jgi:beta-galactosidase